MAQVLTINGKLALQSNGLVVFAPPTNPTQELAALINYDISNSSSYSGSGTALTDIGTEPAMNATLYNGVGYSSEKGGVLTFDGTNDYGLIPYNAAMNSTSFSVLTWFCITTFPERSQYRILTRQAENSYGNNWGYQMGRGDYGLGGTSSEILMFMHANSSSAPKNLVGNTRLALNAWYHGGFTTDGTTHRIYLNGTLDGQTTAPGPLASTNWPISLGALAYTNIFHFPGKIGQVKFFNTALTPEQIAQEFEATKTRFGFTTLEIGKVVDYSIDTTSSYPGSGTTVYDISGSANTHNGTLINGVGYSNAYGGVLTFDGTNDYISITNHTDFDLGLSNEPFTIEGWVYFLSVSGQEQCLFSKGGGTDNWTSTGHSYVMFPYLNLMRFQFKSGTTDAVLTTMSSNSTITINTWYHVVISYDGTTTRMYINGIQQNQTSASNYYKPSSGATIVRIGTTASGAGYYAHEYLGMAKIYKGTYLTGEQVIEAYNTTKARFGL